MDVIIGTALLLIVFLALSGLLRSSLVVASLAKSKAIATAVAESQMEYVRSLSYDAVGTVGGIPPGNIPQYATTTSNGISFVTRTYIEYVDDPKDGLEAADETGITTDYKRIKVSVTYTAAGSGRNVDLISNYAPPGLETTTGGGTLKVNVVNASGQGVPGASVTITNPSTNPSVNLTAFSSDAGIVYLPGAATSTNYRITVTKDGYSTAATYVRDATNQNPTPGYMTIVKDQTTTGTFAIDVLAALTLRTFSPVATTTWSDSFNDASKVASQSSVTVSGGSVTLAGAAGTYASNGSVRSVALTPDYLAGWSAASTSTSLPPGTSVRFHVANGSGTLLPDSALPGNSAGFTGEVDLQGVSKTTYTSLSLIADLQTPSTAVTPALLDWTITYRRGPVPLPNIAFTLTGGKTIGSTGAGAPIYKTNVSQSSDSNGVRVLSLEWDEYEADVPSYDVVDACNAPPYTLAPGASLDSSLVLGTSTAHSALVSVRASGVPVAGANVVLSRSGFTKSVTTSECGAAYFGAVATANDYTITVSASGHADAVATGVSVSGELFYAITF
ncbi:MAG: hypothetical protein QOE22_151 [Candidatus Parcubacteria bacterium]|nr:hypothetical protein [Candidatus Parcubacteria bacterium]